MAVSSNLPLRLFKGSFEQKPGKQNRSSVDTRQRTAEDTPDTENKIRCKACRQVITHRKEMISVNGAHRHSFANPTGLVFEIGCFGSAWGCSHVGPTTNEFTWFKGYFWKIAICGKCQTHLGWRFSASSGHVFHGLILNRLTDL